jgi:hypothetical protein
MIDTAVGLVADSQRSVQSMRGSEEPEQEFVR